MTKISVCIIAYNQEMFIEQTVNSALMQEVDSDFEIVISDDCSTDQTRSIVQNIAIKHPGKIRLLPKETNIGATKNLAKAIQACRGDYIALLEGDDYWTSSQKLQKQLDFLENNPDCSTCYHATQMVNRYGQVQLTLPIAKYKKLISNLYDLIINDSFMATCSIMFRNNFSDKIPDIFFVSDTIADWPLNVLNAEYGDIGYIDEVMSVYRSNSSDIAFTSKRTHLIMQEAVKINEAFNIYFDLKYQNIFNEKISNYFIVMSSDCLIHGEYKRGFWALRESVRRGYNTRRLIKFFFIDFPVILAKLIRRKFWQRIVSKK